MKKSPFAAVDSYQTNPDGLRDTAISNAVSETLNDNSYGNYDLNGDNVVDYKDREIHKNMVENQRMSNMFSSILNILSKRYVWILIIFLIPIMLKFDFLVNIWFFVLPIIIVEVVVGAILVLINHFFKGRFIKQIKLILLVIGIAMALFMLSKYFM